MRWYERLYVGEKAEKNRYKIIQAVREEKKSGYFIVTMASNEKNLFDIFSARTLNQPYYKEKDLLIVGVAADYGDAVALAGKIVGEVFAETGGYDVKRYLFGENAQE